MNFQNFVEKHNIPTINVWYFISEKDGKKIPIGEKNDLTLEEINKIKDNIPPKKYAIVNRKPYYLSTREEESLKLVKSSYLKHTDNIYCLDIDEESVTTMKDFIQLEPIFEECSWTQGNTKGIHIFLRINGLPEYKEQKQIIKDNAYNADLLRVNNVWDIPNKLIYNADILQEYEWNDIQHIFNIEKMNFKKIKSNPQSPTEIQEFNIDDNQKDKYLDLLREIGNPKNPDGSFVIERNSWLMIGAFLKSNDYPMDYFQQYTQLADPFCDVSDTWESLNRRVDYRAIFNLAKRVNPNAYEKWIQKNKMVKFSSACLAKYFGLLYSDKFVVVNTILYYFNGIYWEKSDKNNTELTRFIDKVFIHDLWKYYNQNIKNNSNCKLDIEEIRAFPKNIEDLHKTQIRKHLISDIYIFLTDNSIQFDTNPYLFVYNNCIFDLNLGEIITPNPEDYVSISVGYNYVKSTPEQLKFLEDLIHSILPNEEIKEEYMIMLATGLSGIQIEKLFMAMGGGRNGKGVLNTLMMYLCGNYGYRMPVSCLLQEIKEGPNPELANLHNKRFVVCSEPPENKRIHSESMKTITGEKTLPVRGLYQAECKCNLNLTLVMETNNEQTKLNESKYAELSRIRPVPFKSTFYDDTHYNSLPDDIKSTALRENTYFKKDEFLHEYKCVLFDLLLPYFIMFKDNQYNLKKMPEECEKICRNYVALSDDIYAWFSQYYVKTPTIEESEPIKLSDIYNIFHHSELFDNLSKADKRKYNKTYFVDKIQKNMFLRKYVKDKDSYHNKKQIKAISIVGWTKYEEPQEE